MLRRRNTNVNGQIVIKVLENFGQPATLAQITRHIAKNGGISPVKIKKCVDSILKAGLKHGFIQKIRYKYYVDPLDPEIRVNLGIKYRKAKIENRYKAAKKNAFKTREGAIKKAKKKQAKVVKKRTPREPKIKNGNKQPKSGAAKKKPGSKVAPAEMKKNLVKKTNPKTARSLRALKRAERKSEDKNKPSAVKKSNPKQAAAPNALEKKIKSAEKVASKIKKQSAKKSALAFKTPQEKKEYWAQKLKELCDKPINEAKQTKRCMHGVEIGSFKSTKNDEDENPDKMCINEETPESENTKFEIASSTNEKVRTNYADGTVVEDTKSITKMKPRNLSAGSHGHRGATEGDGEMSEGDVEVSEGDVEVSEGGVEVSKGDGQKFDGNRGGFQSYGKGRQYDGEVSEGERIQWESNCEGADSDGKGSQCDNEKIEDDNEEPKN